MALLLIPLSLAVAISASIPVAAPARSELAKSQACPAAHENAESMVRTFLANPLLPEVKARWNLGTASIEHVELLASPVDEDVCTGLWAAVNASGTSLTEGVQLSFYRSGNMYLIPIDRLRSGVSLDGKSSLDVYDSEFRLIGRFMA